MHMASSHLFPHSYTPTQQSAALGYHTPPMSQETWTRDTRDQSQPRSIHSVSPSLPQRSLHDHLRPHHSLPSPPQQEHSFSHIPAEYHNQHHSQHGRSNSPLSPPASEGLMSPMNRYQQDTQDKLPMDPNLPGIWMSNDTNMLQGHASASPPPLFLEDILRAEEPHNMSVMGNGFMDDHEFQDHGLGIRALKRARSADIPSVVDMHSPYEGSPAPSGAPRDRKKRRLTDPSEANFHCNKCGKYFSRIWNYNAHLETHDPDRPRPHVCRVEECRKAFVRRTDLTRHQACVHAKEKKFRCELCNNMFARKDTLRRHEDDGCPKRVDIASRANKNKPIVWNSQALSFYSSMQQREDAFSNMGYDAQIRPNHYDNGMSSHLPPLSDIVPIQKAATTMW